MNCTTEGDTLRVPTKGIDDPTAEEQSISSYYIYALVDPRALTETGDELLSVFYVGKGNQNRWLQHEKDVLADLEKTERELRESRSSKAQRIRQILDRGERVPALRLSSNYTDAEDAYRAESLAIDTIGAALAAAGRPPLTNATPGHHAGFVWLREHFIYTESSTEAIPGLVLSQVQPVAHSEGATEILVKGTTEAVDCADQRLVARASLPPRVAALGERVLGIQLLEGHGVARRGWDPHDPWSDVEARERARRYWPIGLEKVEGWLAEPPTMPRSLLLGIPMRGQTVVRYAWRIDASGLWDYYPEIQRWGIPLGDRLHDHPRLGKVLTEKREGKEVQVLQSYSSGIRILPAF